MFLNPPEFTPLSKVPTRERNAWKGAYETYRVNVAIPAVRLHAKGAPQFGHWFAVDRYNERVGRYRKVMALLNPADEPADEAESFVLFPGGVFNVGVVNQQVVANSLGKGTSTLAGGGFQFEYVSGALPLHNEHIAGLRSGDRVPL